MGVVYVLVAGIIVGLLGKLIAPGDKDNIPLWATVLAGIAGVLIGWYVSPLVGIPQQTDGIDWLRTILSVVIAVILVIATSALMGRSGKRSVRR